MTRVYYDPATKGWSETRPGAKPATSHSVISDEIEKPFWGYGKVQTSKSKWRGELKARGRIEVGNERAAFDERPELKTDMREELAHVLRNSSGG